MAFTIDKVDRCEGTSTIKFKTGNAYTVNYKVSFSGGWDESALANNTDNRLPKAGAFLGAESNPKSTDFTVYADEISIGLLEGSAYGKDANNVDAKGVALYVVKYIPIDAGFAASPLQRIDVVWGGSDITETVKFDVNGNAIVNSSGQLYSPLPARPIRGADVTITVRVAHNPAATVAIYSNSTNSSAIWGVAKYNGIIGKIQAKPMIERNVAFWEVSYPIRFRRDTWRLKLIDNGTVFLNDDGDQQTVVDDFGQSRQIPVLLDGTGKVLDPSDDPVIYPSNGHPPGNTDDGYEINDEEDWSSLNLPNPFTWEPSLGSGS